ncbi:MAG: LPS export ABC transporter periplasmic protein LptC [Magnetospirillum sp.]|nr:LPS export ABC transporter periplasmic protein LptC [Magnetospirillum sp.]
MTLHADTDQAPPRQHHPKGMRGSGFFADHSRFVGIMKIAMPAAAAVLLGLVMIWPKLSQMESGFKIGFAKLSTKAVETLAMQNARYFGVDDSNRPFAVTAETALQQPGSQDLIYLTLPKADFTSNSGANIVVDAQTGLYHQAAKVLDLAGGVNLFHDSGYELHTATATMDLAHNTGRGTDPVEGQGPQGRIQSLGFEITGKNHDITFTGKSQLTLRAVSAKGAGKGQGKGAKTR